MLEEMKENEYNNPLDKAIKLATIAHSEQTRKSTNIPYILHPLEALTIAGKLIFSKPSKLSELDNQEEKHNLEVLSAAVLHDVIEDTYITYESLEKMFSEKIVELVRMQSEDKTKSWQERKEHTIEMLNNNKDKDVEIVILADKLSNMRAIYKDYINIKDNIWERFNEGKEKQYWYYSSIAENLRQLKHTQEYQEYVSLIEKVFCEFKKQ